MTAFEPQTATEAEGPTAEYRLEDQVGFLLRLAGQRHATIFQALTPHNLTPTQFAALVRLAQLGECSQNELGRLTAMDVATIKGVIDRLRAKGLVRTRHDPRDKRRALISITPENAHIVQELHAVGARISAETLAPLDAGEATEFLRLLRKIGRA